MRIEVKELMGKSGVKFGTSGARGLADQMTDYVCYVYTKGFLQYLESIGEINGSGEVAIAGDLRPSTGRIMTAVGQAARDMGYTAMDCGRVPSPAVALYGITNNAPAIMVTGSHIPADRNGIKFNKCSGEILKADEDGITPQIVEADDAVFGEDGMFASAPESVGIPCPSAGEMYVRRYLDVFPTNCLAGKKIGIYQHSAVGRDILVEIYKRLGAELTVLGRSETFIPVDTEAIRPEDVELAKTWSGENDFFAIVSTDGDSDRPLIADETGEWIRGDVAGILCSRYLGADSVSTPVSCNSAVEKCGYFGSVSRTRIGSPFVIASMNEASATGARCVVGYEANGGYLINSDITIGGKELKALPTRDAVILHLGIILLAGQQGKAVSDIVADLPQRFTASDRLEDFPQESSQAILAKFSTGDDAKDKAALETLFGDLCGSVDAIDRTDGVRVTFGNSEVIHMRPSGNAPEFRCYNEASSQARVTELSQACMDVLKSLC
ncbi:phosphomannomutase [bacterium F16]|nr:phosphomannomutase [bacterium F16]